MRIYLADLCYLNEWDTNNPVPLNVGYVAAYLRSHRRGDDVRLFKDPVALLQALDAAPPDVLALSHYDWNANLNLPFLARARERKPDVVTVMGGPNFDAGDREWVAGFFLRRPHLDAYITGEGEASFVMLVDLIDRHGTVDRTPFEERPSSMYAFNREAQMVVHHAGRPIARLDLSTVPSPYLTGLLDEFLADARLAPIVETNRGCPYSCAYCCWGQATQSKVNRFPLDTVLAEIRHAARATRNPSGLFYLADGNFGILERDQEIAEVLQECTHAHGVPKRVYVYFAKNTNERVIRIAETLSSVTMMSMSKQTLNPEVLDHVRRKNIPVAQYDALRRECEKRGIETYSELIYGLAGESDDSFIDGVIATIREGQRVTMYPQLLLAGAESGERAYRERFGLKTALRVIPRYVGSYGDIHSLEYEEIVVEHDRMSRDGYFRIRLFQFLVTVFASQSFQEFNRALRHANLDYGTLARIVAGDRARWTPGLTELLDELLARARSELVEHGQRKTEFTADDISQVRTGQLALNPFVFCLLVSRRDLIDGLRTYLGALVGDGIHGAVPAESRGELEACLEVAFDRLICYDPLESERVVARDFDFEAWLLADDQTPLEAFRTPTPCVCTYRIEPGVREAVARHTDDGLPLAEAIYRVRLNIMGTFFGDRVFSYSRATPGSAGRDRRASVHAGHANLAVRH